MNYHRTGRKFTLTLRTQDGIFNNNLYGQASTYDWVVNWRNIMPADIPPNSTFLCKHSFKESTNFGAFLRDLGNTVRRSFLLSSNLPSYSSFTNSYVSINDILVANPNASMPGYLNTMYEKDRCTTATYGPTTGVYFNTWLSGFTAIGNYTCDPHEFEVFSPESNNHITIFINEMIPVVPTFTDLDNFPAYFGYSLTNGNKDKLIPTYPGNATNNVLPQFWAIYPQENDGEPTGISQVIFNAYGATGDHVFEFELVTKYQEE